MDKDNAIEIRNMTKSFRLYSDGAKTLKERLIRKKSDSQIKTVLEDISLDIRKGETVALIGTNGSGKSTLLKTMTKILYPNKGTVETQGKLTSLLELGAGFHPDFTGRENIYFNASVFGMTRSDIEKRIDDIIEFSELGSFIDEPVRTYSSGMYMRLAFSVAINVDADILLIDEILAVGDQHFQNKCFDKLEELRDSEKTIVIVSHSLETVQSLCSRAVWIYHGRVRLDGDPAYVIRQYLKQSAIDNREEFEKAKKDETVQRKGVLYVDSPANFTEIRPGENLQITGWAVSNAISQKIELSFEDKTFGIDRKVSRPDVFEVYEEEYNGLFQDDHLGFEASFTIPEGADEDSTLMVVLKDRDQILDRKRIRIRVKS